MPAPFSCPRCGSTATDDVYATAGWCEECKDFTRACGAGHPAPGGLPLEDYGWTVPCQAEATQPWELRYAGSVIVRTGLCDKHGAELELRQSPDIIAKDRPAG